MATIRFGKSIAAATLALGLVFSSGIVASEAAAVKVGAKCSTLKKKTTVGLKTYTCVKSGSKKVWKLTYTAPALGSVKRPVPLGTSFKIGNFKYTLNSYIDDASTYVCAENMFNDGCTYDDNYDGIPDPYGTTRWVQFNVTAENLGSNPEEPYIAEVGAVVGGKLVSQGIFGPAVSDDLNDMTILPGFSDSGSLYLELDFGKYPSQMVLIPSAWDNKYYFFKLQ